MAMAKYIKTSPQKFNLVAATIRGKDAGQALVDLEFSPRRVAQDVRKVLQSVQLQMRKIIMVWTLTVCMLLRHLLGSRLL